MIYIILILLIILGIGIIAVKKTIELSRQKQKEYFLNKIIEFFKENNEKRLTKNQIMLELKLPDDELEVYLKELVHKGILDISPTEKGDLVYNLRLDSSESFKINEFKQNEINRKIKEEEKENEKWTMFF